MDTQIIYEKIKFARMQRFISNCYSIDIVERCNRIWFIDDGFLFTYTDHGINRLVYFAKDWNTVDELLGMVDHGRYYLEFITKDIWEYAPTESLLTASMMRMTNPDCRIVFESGSGVLQYKGAAVIEEAQESDVGEINKILYSTFHTEVSHLPNKDELREKIRENQITVHRDNGGHIDALLQAEVMPKKFYINQIVNNADKCIIHAMLLDKLEKYIAVGGKYLYAWVEDKNIASLKFHKKYGMRHDGMWSRIYYLER